MYLLVGLSESWKSNTRFLHLYRGLRGRLFFCLSSWSDSQQRADEGPLSLLNIPWLTQMMSLTRCGPHDSTITRSSGRGGVDVGGVAEGKRRRWRCSLFHISSAVDFFINHPTSTPPPQLTPPSRSFSTITCLLRHIGGDVQQTLNAELKSLDAAAYVCDTQSSKSTHTYGTADTPPESFKSCRLWINMTKQISHHISKQHGRLCNWNIKCSSIFCAIEKSIKWNVSGICMTFTTINSRRQ